MKDLIHRDELRFSPQSKDGPVIRNAVRRKEETPAIPQDVTHLGPVSHAAQGRQKPIPSFLEVSVVVPTCGRADLLNRCLAALAAQELDPKRYEILIVDDDPSPSTRHIVKVWSDRMKPTGLEISYLPNPGPHGPAAARNRGWQASASDIIAFTDDDTIPTAQWLSKGLEAFGSEHDKVDAIWGSIEMPLSKTPTDYERDAKHLETAEFVTANCICRKSILNAIQGFDETFRYAWREDSDFYFRLLDAGAHIAHIPQAIVIHPVRPAPWGVSISQQKKILFDALLYKKHPYRYREKIRATPRWDYYLIVVSLIATLCFVIAGKEIAASFCATIWAGMTAWLFAKRMQGTARTASHIVEMLLTSLVIPPLAVYWRMVGAWRFRVAFL